MELLLQDNMDLLCGDNQVIGVVGRHTLKRARRSVVEPVSIFFRTEGTGPIVPADSSGTRTFRGVFVDGIVRLRRKACQSESSPEMPYSISGLRDVHGEVEFGRPLILGDNESPPA